MVAEATDAFVERLEKWRESLKMSNNSFARDMLGVDKTTWSQIRRGLSPANPKFIGRIVLKHPWLARYLDAPKAKSDA